MFWENLSDPFNYSISGTGPNETLQLTNPGGDFAVYGRAPLNQPNIMKDKLVSKAIAWAEKKGFQKIKANVEEYEAPRSFTQPGSNDVIIPDVTGEKLGKKSTRGRMLLRTCKSVLQPFSCCPEASETRLLTRSKVYSD